MENPHPFVPETNGSAGPDPIEPEPLSTPVLSGGEQNVYDQPLQLVMPKENLALFYFGTDLLSCNVLALLRRRVGERNLRMWVILLNIALMLLPTWLVHQQLPTPAGWLQGQASAPESSSPALNSPYAGSPYGGSPYGGSPYGGSPYASAPGFQPLVPTAPRQSIPASAPVQPPSSQGDGGAWMVKLYALALLIVGAYQAGMSKEWGEIPPGLHSRSRGESRLGGWLNARVIPREWHGWGIDYSFTQHCLYISPWFPLEERVIHAWLEPLLLLLLGWLLCCGGAWMMGVWLLLSAIALKFSEFGYYDRGRSMHLDRRDARFSAKAVARTDAQESKAQSANPDSEPLIDAGLPVQISEELLARRKSRRLRALMESPEEESASDPRIQGETPEERRNGKGGQP